LSPPHLYTHSLHDALPILTNEEGGIIPSPFIDGIVPIILIFFILIGIAFGITTGKIKSTKDATYYMTESIKDMAGYIVLEFAIRSEEHTSELQSRFDLVCR